MHWQVIEDDCVAAMAAMPAGSVDAIVTDPPYGLEFMGKDWDRPWAVGFSQTGYTDGGKRPARPSYGSNRNPCCRACRKHKRGTDRCLCQRPDFDESPSTSSRLFGTWCEAWAPEALRVLKPGGHLVAFGGTRTYHRLTCAIEDAGFEIRDEVLSVFETTEAGRQFLASMSPAQLKALDALGGGPLAWLYGSGFPKSLDVSKAIDKAAGAEREVVGVERTPWKGSGGAVTGVHGEAYRPTGDDGYVTKPITAPATPDAERWQGWGTALKPAHEPIVLARKPLTGTVAATVLAHGTGALNVDGCRIEGEPDAPGTTPATLTNDGTQTYGKRTRSEYVVPVGRWPANVVLDPEAAAMLDEQTGDKSNPNGGDTGGASRFFYVAKADSAERNTGLHGQRNPHPTVKPVALMRWLCRLVTPPGGIVLDPFVGSGTTGIAALREGFSFIGIEREAEYVAIARARIIGDAPLINGACEVTA